ncbi:hypothetical protein [Kribbella sp. DT2]|uniref:hypothetical protein n=1 Tax=Kribbella sp. DT2 TaxID=3393427 RepID=UPI003CFACCE2
MKTATEVIETLTGFDEDEIEKVCGKTVEALTSEGRQLKLIRALSAVVVSRNEGIKLAEAFKRVQGMAQTEVSALFEEEPDEPFPDEPESLVGKGS